MLEFLNKRIKPKSDDPDEKWITTWNDYLGRFKFLEFILPYPKLIEKFRGLLLDLREP